MDFKAFLNWNNFSEIITTNHFVEFVYDGLCVIDIPFGLYVGQTPERNL